MKGARRIAFRLGAGLLGVACAGNLLGHQAPRPISPVSLLSQEPGQREVPSPTQRPGERKVPSEYATVSEAMRAAQPGDTIAIAAGEYEVADLRVKERIRLTGAGRDATVLWAAAENEAL